MGLQPPDLDKDTKKHTGKKIEPPTVLRDQDVNRQKKKKEKEKVKNLSYQATMQMCVNRHSHTQAEPSASAHCANALRTSEPAEDCWVLPEPLLCREGSSCPLTRRHKCPGRKLQVGS